VPKILGQAGISLADTYDVEGSAVDVENLETKDVNLVDEMGSRTFSERLLSFVVNMPTGAIAASTAFSATLPSAALGLPDFGPNRILGVTVLNMGDAADITRVCLSLEEVSTGFEYPIWEWDDATGVEVSALWDIGSGEANVQILIPISYRLPELAIRTGNARQMPNLRMRGSTSAGVGVTVVIRALWHLARPYTSDPSPGEVQSHGLPLPGW